MVRGEADAAAEGAAPGAAPGSTVPGAQQCFCHVCMREVLAAMCPDFELRCPLCRGTCVEILEQQAPPPQVAAAFEAPLVAPLVAPLATPLAPLQTRSMGAARHLGVQCDSCQARDFFGTRYRCLRCPDFDLCERCYELRHTNHPDHPFEAIRTPRSMFRGHPGHAEVAEGAPHGVSRTVVTILEISIEDDPEARSGLDDTQVAWWLADDKRLAVTLQDSWVCPICSEGTEAEGSNGWIVRICNERRSSASKRPSGGSAQDDASAKPAEATANSESPATGAQEEPEESEGHVYHEACLRRWLLKKNACPVCRRTPIIPVP